VSEDPARVSGILKYAATPVVVGTTVTAIFSYDTSGLAYAYGNSYSSIRNDVRGMAAATISGKRPTTP